LLNIRGGLSGIIHLLGYERCYVKEELNANNPKNHKCVICGNTNVETIDLTENSMGEFVIICHCKDCDIEFEVKS